MNEYEKQLRATTIGEPQRVDGHIFLAEYDPAWPGAFEREAARIRQALGDRALLVEHAGSTSVPGLAAKPRIDIVLALPDSSAEDDYVPPMEAAGYELRIREPDWHEHRVFKRADAEVNVHVFTVGCSEIERMLRFRDWLRANPADRDLYLAKKRELAPRDWEFVQQYADEKGELVEQILVRAGAPSSNPSEKETPRKR